MSKDVLEEIIKKKIEKVDLLKKSISLNSLNEQIENVTNVLDKFDIISIDEVGYPDYLDYEGNGGVALSWWKFTFKNKKSGEIKRMNIHSQMWFNNKGKIGREDVYYNANLLN